MNKHFTLLLFIGLTFWNCEDIDLPNACNDMYAPVCGSDGVTYGNDCYARNEGISEWTLGECDCIDESQISDTSTCTEQYAPVCGCNRVTYDNDCHAERSGVTEWSEGECVEADS